MRGAREQIQLPGGHSFRVLHWTQTVRDVEMVLGNGASLALKGEGTHWHYHAAMELTLFIAGQGTRFVGDRIEPFASGDLVLLGEKLPHYWHTHGPSAGLSVQWEFPSGHPFWTFPEMLPLAPVFESAGRGLRFTGRAASALAALMGELLRTSGPARFALLLRLFAQIAAASESDRVFLSSRHFALPAASAHQQAMAEAVRYLLAHFREEIRLEELLRLTGLSKPTFSRLFRKVSGKTFSDFLAQIRLQSACRELTESTRSVLEIALFNGFSQISFFNRLFRRCFGCSPTQFRAQKSASRLPP